MIRHLIFLSVLLLPVIGFGAESAPEPKRAVSAMAEICLASLVKNLDVAQFAAEKQYPELPADKAAKFWPVPSRVFGVPGLLGEAVLIVPKAGGSCSLALRQISIEGFWQTMDVLTGPNSSFTLVRDRRLDEEKVTKKNTAPRVKHR